MRNYCSLSVVLVLLSVCSAKAETNPKSEMAAECRTNSTVFLQADGMRTLTLSDLLTTPCTGCVIDIVGPLTTTLDCSTAGKVVAVQIIPPAPQSSFFCSVKVEDIMPPVITCADVMVGCDLDVFEDPPSAFGVSATDNCGEIEELFPLLCGSEPGNCIDTLKKLKILWQAIDSSGNIDTCTQYVSYPVNSFDDVVCPPTQFDLDCRDADLEKAGEPLLFGTESFPKNCGLILEGPSLDTFRLCGSEMWIQRVWTVFNPCTWEVDSCVQKVFIEDLEGPIIECPTTIDTLYLDADDTLCKVDFLLPVLNISGQNCDGDSIVANSYLYKGVFYDPGTEIQVDSGTQMILCIATDACWKMDTCTLTVEVIDSFELLIECAADVCMPVQQPDATFADLIDLDCDSLARRYGAVQISEMSPCCPIDSITCSLDTVADLTMMPLEFSPEDTLFVLQFIAYDSCGNTDTCHQAICATGASRVASRSISVRAGMTETESPLIFPNPFSDQITVAFPRQQLSIDKSYQVTIMTQEGGLQRSLLRTDVMTSIEDLSEFPPGLILVRIQSPTHSWTYRLLKL